MRTAVRGLLKLNSSLRIFEGEGECTSEMHGGQFSIFGAIEEKSIGGFPKLTHSSARLRTLVFASISADAPCAARNLVEWAAGLSTGSAQEMQKGGTQYSVGGSYETEGRLWGCHLVVRSYFCFRTDSDNEAYRSEVRITV